MDAGFAHGAEELAYREGDGLEVTLLWSKADDSLTVICADTRTGDWFTVAAEPQNALDVFAHPYPYAAHQGVRYAVPSPRCAEAIAA
jgi:hypothetical protein